ncbi:MAG: IPT/TIG domain-containing protein, partial [Actinobacteria bacterium]|nr:IPT/TIG domain-containing protein [Actinomycetota bacterium]
MAGPVAAQSGPPASLVMYPLSTPDAEPWDLAVGPDGNLWSPYNFASTIAQITPAGSVREFSVPPSLVFPVITAGGDGNLWFLDLGNNNVDRMTPDGATITPFHIPVGNGGPNGITLGPDGNVWFTQFQTGQVGFVTPAGAVTEFNPAGTKTGKSHPLGITAGPDGNVWFADSFKDVVGRITPSGVITEFDTPSLRGGGPYQITKGPDGNLWYTTGGAGTIGRITTAGVATEFVLPAGTHPDYITSGPDGNLWFTARDNNEIGRITPDGQVGLFTPSGTGYVPQNIIAGPDSRLWFTMLGPARVGAFAPFAPAPSAPDVQSLEPRFGPTTGGTKVLITGYEVGSATKVLFGNRRATSFTVVGPGQIEAVAPPHAAGQVDVTVVTPSGTTATGTASHFFYPSPQCGKTISKSTTLQSDIGPCYGDGVTVKTNGVTFDLNGKRIYSFSEPSDGNAAGVRLTKRAGVQVKNGTVSGFDAGVVISGGGSN